MEAKTETANSKTRRVGVSICRVVEMDIAKTQMGIGTDME